jgi:hypothetical protein
MRIFYIGLKNGLLMIQETVNGFDVSRHLREMKLNRLAIDPKDEMRLFAATDHGLWRSEDRGASWERIDKDFKTSNITAVAVSPHLNRAGRQTIYAGTEPSHLYFSDDNGVNWTEFINFQRLPSKKEWAFPPRPETHYVRWLTSSANNPDYLAVAIEAGAVVFTKDHGATWHDRAEVGPIDVHTLLMHPKASNRLYAANGGWVSNKGRESYAESSDGGESWEFMSEGLEEQPYLYHLTLHPTEPDYRLASASQSARKAHRQPAYSTVYRKVGQEPWQEFADGLPREGAFSHHLAQDPNDVDSFYVMNNFGIYHLGAEETTWKKLDMDWPEELKNMRAYFFVVR